MNATLNIPTDSAAMPSQGATSRISCVDRLTYRLDEIAVALGVSRRSIEREKSAGRLPRPDLHVGKMPLWRVETIRRWVEGGGR
jgi:hypothetical protein